MSTIERYESEVRGYCRAFPATFAHARGSHLFDTAGESYLDFFSGAGVLNYGHNPEHLKERLIAYLQEDGITHSLDMFTAAKERFLERFHEVILEPRRLSYKVQFPGPTGTNAVEAALKLARKVTGRSKILAFTNGFHGMTLGSLSVTGNDFNRSAAGVPLVNVVRMPFDSYQEDEIDSLAYLEAVLEDGSSGVDKPAAAIVETVQAEGGVNVASFAWLRRLADLLKRHEVLLIVDDIQVGCGRTGPFFSFEPAGIEPDIVCLSKSLSGYGLPLSVVLIQPHLDVWQPGEHNGTFRGHNPAFVTATAALDFWTDEKLEKAVRRKAAIVEERLVEIVGRNDLDAEVRGRGLIQGIAFDRGELAARVSAEAFARHLVVETAGAESQVLKLLPPLTIDDRDLARGLDIIAESTAAVTRATDDAASPAAAAN